jgi:hypothetical protein
VSTAGLFVLWSLGWPAVGAVLGLLGLRILVLRWFVAGLGGAYALLLLAYFAVRGGPNECTSAGCRPTSFLSDIGPYGVFVIVFVTVLALAPIVGAWAGVRWPAVAAAVLLVGLIVLNPFGLAIWVPAASAVIASAVAGPPRPYRAGAIGPVNRR